MILVGVAFVAGIITGVSPCVLPVVPVMVAGGASGVGRWRPYAIIAGLVTSFSVVILVGGSILSFLHLPQDLLYDLGIAMLLILGISLMVPAIGRLTEKPFERLGRRGYARGSGSGFVLGLSLGPVFAPCAGPVFTTITTVAGDHRVGLQTVSMMLAYAIGTAVPLLAVAVGTQYAARVSTWIRAHAQAVRSIGGVFLVATAVAFMFSWFDPLKDVPGYTNRLQNAVENSASVQARLAVLTHHHPRKELQAAGETLPRDGVAPDFRGVTAWINTGGKALHIAQLRGHVVLVDFWTYSCINCLRSLPHVEAWYREYHRYGLDVIGVHSPEFAFEHVVGNVRAAVARLGIRYPVAVDDDLDTWNAYQNNYWPAEYVIDARGEIRDTSFGEGDYSKTETDIRELLVLAGSSNLPPPTDTPDRTPTELTTSESYVGYERADSYVNNLSTLEAAVKQPTRFGFPGSIPDGGLALSGVWRLGPQSATAGRDAELRLRFMAKDVYLVLGGSGTVRVSVDGRARGPTIHVDGIPDLYTMYAGPYQENALLQLDVSPGIVAYDFTFG